MILEERIRKIRIPGIKVLNGLNEIEFLDSLYRVTFIERDKYLSSAIISRAEIIRRIFFL